MQVPPPGSRRSILVGCISDQLAFLWTPAQGVVDRVINGSGFEFSPAKIDPHVLPRSAKYTLPLSLFVPEITDSALES